MRIVLNGIEKRFNDQLVLDRINLDEDVRSLAVIGPSGGGKSTLLRIIGGLLLPDAGTMSIDGENVSFSEKTLRAYRRSIGFVFQSKGLFAHMSALENVILPLVHTYGQNRTDAIAAAEIILDRFGLKEHAGKFPAQLSGGQQQRIAIARAIMVRPKMLLLDEPTSALDPEYTAEVLNMLSQLQDEGLNTIIVTHEMGFAKRACEKALFLADSTIVECAPSRDLFETPKSDPLRSFLSTVLEWNA